MPGTPFARMPDVSEDSLVRYAEALSGHAGLDDVMSWCSAQDPPRDSVEVVVQDEFTHDLIIHLDDGLYAVYDTT